jgi:hypothetical protein
MNKSTINTTVKAFLSTSESRFIHVTVERNGVKRSFHGKVVASPASHKNKPNLITMQLCKPEETGIPQYKCFDYQNVTRIATDYAILVTKPYFEIINIQKGLKLTVKPVQLPLAI